MGIKKLVGVIALASMISGTPAMAAENTAEEIIPMVNDGTRIVINLASRGLYLLEKGVKTALYPIACGKPSTKTPVGYYKISEKTVNPIWVDPHDSSNVVYSGEDNPLGYRWIGLKGYYGIHGTNNPASIGTYASLGCIRMFEADVEALYDKVAVGTPVDVFYNRVVVEKSPEDTVVYYIYPDAYGIQPLNVEQVNEWLRGYGVQCFESDADIAEKINASDGQPTYIAKSYNLILNGQTIDWKAVEQDGIFYLPVLQMADALGQPIYYERETSIVRTGYGMASVNTFKNVLYINADDVEVLFHIRGGKQDNISMKYDSY